MKSLSLTDFVLPIVLLLVFRYVAVKASAIYFAWAQIKSVPGGVHINVLDPESSIGSQLPHIPRMSVGDVHAKWTPYEKAGTTILASVPFVNPRPMFWVADPASLKQIAGDRHTFPKRAETYEAISFYGPNVVSTEGQEWRRHRDAAKSAFGESNNALVWTECMRVAREWFSVLDNSEKDTKGGVLTEVHQVMTSIALLIISAAGFGRIVSFTDDANTAPPEGHKLAFKPALITAVHTMGIKVLTPTWLYKLPIPWLQEKLLASDLAYLEVKKHLTEMIEKARSALISGKGGESRGGAADLFQRLIEANEGDADTKAKLSDSELLSNTYTFLLAGHETTANALSFCMALLALHPDIQRKLQQEADEIWPNGLPEDGTQSYREDMPKLRYADAVFRETTRVFPAEPRLTKMVTADTILKASRRATGTADGNFDERYDVPVPKGSTVWLDIWATHMSPLYWGPDVEEFRPERFIDTDSYKWPRDAYLPFMIGPRSCMGQRFAMLEGICILSHIARQYDIRLPDSLVGLSLEEQEKALLGWSIGVALTAQDVKLRFVKRSQ